MFLEVVFDDVGGDFACVPMDLFHGIATSEAVRNPGEFNGITAGFFGMDDIFNRELHGLILAML